MYSTRKGSNLSNEDDEEFMSRDDILAEIASLDERYEVGEDDGTPVNLDKYYDRRNELKRMALEINDESDDNEGETKPADSDN